MDESLQVNPYESQLYDELDGARARIAALEVQLAAAEERGAREYERGVVDAFGFLWRGVGRRDFAVKKFLQEQAGITACADDAADGKREGE